MAAEVTGRVTNIYPVEMIAEKPKQSFTIKTSDQYPKDIAFECWGKTVEFLAKAKVGDEVTVSYDISSREYNNKWYTSAKAFKIVVNGTAQVHTPQVVSNSGSQDIDQLPF